MNPGFPAANYVESQG